MSAPLEADWIALAFTDVVSSTELTLRYREAYGQAQQTYRRLVREGLLRWGGTEIKTLGDGFFVTFDDPVNAAHWAKETQIELIAYKWPLEIAFQIRIGLHYGCPVPVVHPDGRTDFDGDAVILASRLMDEAGGGQIFVSRAFHQRTRQELNPPFELRGLGQRNLKGLGETDLWNLAHADLPVLFAPHEPSPSEIPPSNLPFPPNAHFFGREEVLFRLREQLLSPGGQTVALVGMGGLGKTQLAIEYAHANLLRYPGGVFWLDARSDERLIEGYLGIGGRFFGSEAGEGREHRAEQIRDALIRIKKPVLLIFDNVTEATDLDLLPPSGRLHLLLTTQRQILPANVLILEPPRLGEEAAFRLLQVFRQASSEREQEAALQIVRAVGCLPLALALASHHIRALGCSFTDYCRRLTENPYGTLQKGREHFQTATRHTGSIYDTIDLSVRGGSSEGAGSKGLDENALKTLTAASCFAPNSIPASLLFQVCGIRDEEAFEAALLRLWERSLLTREPEEDSEGRQSIHELIREYARANLLPARRKGLLPRAVKVVTSYLQDANRTMEWANLRNDLDHCLAVAAAAQGKPAIPGLEYLLLEIGVYFVNRRDYAEALKHFSEGLARVSNASRSRSLLRAEFLRRIGEVQQEGQLASEDCEKALANVHRAWKIACALLKKENAEMAEFSSSLGFVLKKQGKLKRALPFYHHALSLCREKGSALEKAVLLNNLGVLLEELEDFPASLNYFEQALELEEKEHREKNLHCAILLNNIGRVLGKLRRSEEALSLHERAREIAETVQGARHPDTAACFYYLAEAQRELGRRDEALANYRRARKSMFTPWVKRILLHGGCASVLAHLNSPADPHTFTAALTKEKP